MTGKNKKGMWLRPAERLSKKDFRWILQTAVSMLAYVVLVLTFAELTGFEKLYDPWVLLLTGDCLFVIHGGLSALHRQGWFLPGVLLLLLVLVLLCRQQILEGICLFWNQLGDTWTAASGWVLPKLETHLNLYESGTCLRAFSVLFGGLGALLCCLLVSGGAPVLAVVLPGLLLIGEVLFHRNVSLGHLLLVLVTAVLVLLYGGWGKEKVPPAVVFSWMICAAAACVVVLCATLPGVESWAAQFSQQLDDSVHKHKFETQYTTLPEGHFTNYSQVNGEAQPALVVSMEKPESMYLRGFTGAVFENNTWSALNTQVLAENEELLYWLNLNGFDPRTQFKNALCQMEAESNLITVQNIGACSRYLYVPFSLCPGDFMQAENLNSDGITSDAERIYVLSSVSGGAEMIGQVVEYLQASNEESVLYYRKAESAYRSFVFRCYLQIPQEAADVLAEQWDELAARYGGKEELTSEQAQECVRNFLTLCFAKEGSTEDMELPLSMVEGTSFQYATVAALTLRYFGIPARYAEGYVITEEMASSAEEGASIHVDSSCAQAWVEVYQDGIGWIPMDLAAGFGELTQEGNGNDPNLEEENNENPTPQEGEELEERKDNNQEDPEPDGGTMVKVPKAVFFGGLFGLLLLLLMILLLVVRRAILARRKEKRFRAENRNDAIAWIFADTVQMLEELGFDRGNGSMQALCVPVQERFGREYAMEFQRMIDLNSSAIFCSRTLTEDQRRSALDFRSATLLHLQSGTKWPKRLWMKWIQCL